MAANNVIPFNPYEVLTAGLLKIQAFWNVMA
jgi:hypothetical protein